MGINLYYVPSASMSPTLLPGDLILIDTRAYAERQPQAGEVVVFSVPGQPGRFQVKRIHVPSDEGEFIMRGDNVSASLDSRYYGEIPFENLHGKALRFIRYRPHHALFRRILFGHIQTDRSL
ncbi:S26 family signal peptidase [Tamilnaduibacter salinus]|uniref:Signal peptidase I n=1 Tax=Tamilnaduibacter salinus TaxID=1484056 RepID=A0A2A2HYX9_9GAMM|nr:S26 family signal peptidase [Tamilnaduibacter salinus]